MGFIKSFFINSTLNQRVQTHIATELLGSAFNNLNDSSVNILNSLEKDIDNQVNEIFNKYYSNSCFASWRKSAIKFSIEQHICAKRTNAIATTLKQFNEQFRGRTLNEISEDEINTFAQKRAKSSAYLSADGVVDIVRNNQQITSILMRNHILSKRCNILEVETDKIPHAKNTMKEINDNLYLAKHLKSYSQLRCLGKENFQRKYNLYAQYRDYLKTEKLNDSNKEGYYTYVSTGFQNKYNPEHLEHQSLFADIYDGKTTRERLDATFKASFEDKFSKLATPFLNGITLDETTRELINHGELFYKTLKSTLDICCQTGRAEATVINTIANMNDKAAEKIFGKTLTPTQEKILTQSAKIFNEEFINDIHIYYAIIGKSNNHIINLIAKETFNGNIDVKERKQKNTSLKEPIDTIPAELSDQTSEHQEENSIVYSASNAMLPEDGALDS